MILVDHCLHVALRGRIPAGKLERSYVKEKNMARGKKNVCLCPENARAGMEACDLILSLRQFALSGSRLKASR